MNIDNKTLFKWIRVAFTILTVVFVIYAGISFSAKAFDFGYRIFTETPVDEEPGVNVEIVIEEGMTVTAIGDLLEKNGLIRDGDLFWLQYKLSAYSGRIRPGTYTLNSSMTVKEMMIIMCPEPAKK